MFGVALDRVQSLFSRDFLTAAFGPWLVFTVSNLLMLEAMSPAAFSPGWATPLSRLLEQDAAKQALAGAAGVVVVTALAALTVPLQPALRAALAGSWLPTRLQGFLRLSEVRRRRAMNAKIEALSLQQLLMQLTLPEDKSSEIEKYSEKLRIARREGMSAKETDPASLKNGINAIDHLLKAQNYDKVKGAFDAVEHALKKNDARKSKEAVRMHLEFLEALEILRTANKREIGILHADLGIMFPRDEVAPTRLGNIIGGLRTYALLRYGINLDVIWPRLRFVLPKDSPLFSALADSEARVALLVLMVFMSVSFTIFWTMGLFLCGSSSVMFLAVAVGGPILTWGWYWLACQAYLEYGNLVRAALDLHRHNLMRALCLDLPYDSSNEQKRWTSVSQWLAYGQSEAVFQFSHRETM